MTSTSFKVNCVSTLNVPLECLFTDLECYARRGQRKRFIKHHDGPGDDGDDDTVRWMYDDAEDRLNALLDGGEHMDDHTDNDRWRNRSHREVVPWQWIHNYRVNRNFIVHLMGPVQTNCTLLIHNYIVSNGYRRPPIRNRR
eukprot:scaffold2365_cov111-Alexandrium_tamarense.AAC.5